jgi:hypothetical protein
MAAELKLLALRGLGELADPGAKRVTVAGQRSLKLPE